MCSAFHDVYKSAYAILYSEIVRIICNLEYDHRVCIGTIIEIKHQIPSYIIAYMRIVSLNTRRLGNIQ